VSAPARPLLARRAGVAVAVVLAGLMAMLLPDAISAQRAAYHAGRADEMAARLAATDWMGSNEAASNSEFAELIAEAGLASSIRPDDVEYHQFLNEYRWRSLGRWRDEQTHQPIFTEAMLGHVRRVVAELHKGRLLCPTYGPALALAGDIEFFYLNDPVGADHIRLAAQMSPHDAMTFFITGELDASGGHFDAALEHLRRAVTLDPNLTDPAVKIFVDETHRPDLAAQLSWDNAQGLMRLADMLDDRKTAPDTSGKCRDQAFTLLVASTLHPNPPAADLASLADLYRLRNNPLAACDYYTRALESDYSQAIWHLKLAECMESTGRRTEAYHEAMISLRFQPGMPEAKQLMDRTREYTDTRPAAVPATGGAAP
jgi:tetratricopeptide (TPR) repeat protein